ncbi:MFS transporter [Bacillus spongiae]|uniref:MFS transporter n=1 Tax=Bacillus spongiae TaxID=2683610 RepID=A0ABU8HAY3_9BACI
MNRWKLFKQKNFVLYWLGYLFSALGDAIFILITSWFIVQKTGSGVTMGTFLLFVGVPRVIFMIIGGIVVDRVSPRAVMFWSDLLRAVILFIFVFLSIINNLHVPILFSLGVAFGIVDAFYWPSITAMRQRIVDEHHYTQSNSVLTATWQASAILGPLLGAGIIGLISFTFGFGVTGLFFLLSALTLFFLRLKPKKSLVKQEKQKNIMTELLVGAKFVLSNRLLLVIIITALFGNAAMSTITVGLPFLAKEYKVGAEGLGHMSASLGIGGMIMSVLLAVVIVIKKPHPRLMMAVLFAQGMFILFIGYTQNHWQVALLIGLIGGAGATLGILEQSISQSIIPQHLIGRVYSVILVVAQGITPLAQALSGWLIDVIGVHQIYLIGGPIQVVAAGIAFFLPVIVYYDQKPFKQTTTSYSNIQ